MRGDLALTARLLLRGAGLAGLTITVGGALAVIAASQPWYLAVAEMTMLGEQQERTVATLAGAPATVLGWAAVVVGVGAAVIGTSIALDRQPVHATRWLLGAAITMLLAAATGWLDRPSLGAVAGSDGEEFLELAERLPSGVELTMVVRPGVGPLLLVLAALLVGVGTYWASDGERGRW